MYRNRLLNVLALQLGWDVDRLSRYLKWPCRAVGILHHIQFYLIIHGILAYQPAPHIQTSIKDVHFQIAHCHGYSGLCHVCSILLQGDQLGEHHIQSTGV